jgi:hypothetical protein
MTKIIWTKHALGRLDERKIPKNLVFETISSPDSKHNSNDGSIEIQKNYGNQQMHVILKENEKKEFIILSCWINPPSYGSKDFKNKQLSKRLKKSSWIKKFWYTFLNQIGF